MNEILMKNFKYVDHIIVLTIGMLACGIVAVYLGKELCWDLANYHYYNPYAFLHDRLRVDFWPSSNLHVRFIPTVDFLSYFLIYKFSSIQAVFILGAIHGINFWLLFQISHFFIRGLENKTTIILALVLTIFGLYGPTALSGIGSFQHDDLISIFILSFFLLLSKTLYYYSDSKKLSIKWTFAAGLLLGIGTGLKLTAALFIVGSAIAFLILPIRFSDKAKLLLFWGLGVFLGIVLSGGYWMLILWKQFHNPFFPFFNGIFRSSDFLPINFKYSKFLPQSVWEILFFPFYFSWKGTSGDGLFQDFRFLIVYVLLIIASIKWFWRNFYKKADQKPDLLTFWLYAFFISSYIVWEYYFSIMRYMVALEMLAPLMIYLLARKMIQNFHTFITFLFFVFLIILFSLAPLKTFRIACLESSFFNVQLPSFVKPQSDAMVLLAYPAYALNLEPKPQAYLIPFFPSKWSFVGVPFLDGKFLPDMKASEKILDLIKKHPGNFYLLTTDISMPELYRIAQDFGLVAQGECGEVLSDRQKISSKKVLLCPVIKPKLKNSYSF